MTAKFKGYRCKNCGFEFAELDDDISVAGISPKKSLNYDISPELKCPECGSLELEKLD